MTGLWRPTPPVLLAIAGALPNGHDMRATALAAGFGDETAASAVVDWLQDQGEDMRQPLEVGKSYLICTVTLYYVGRVAEAAFGWVRLEDASWVHWTGRLSLLLAKQDFKARELQSRKPRVEPCGEVILSLAALVSAYPWTGKLPREPIE